MDKVSFSIDTNWDIHFDFPAFKDFDIYAKQTIDAWWFPEWLTSPIDQIELIIKDLDL